MTPEERLISALRAQNKIVFGNTIGVDSNNECTVVSEDGELRAIAGMPISSGSCIALQTEEGKWYAVSARESGSDQKTTIYKRKNRPISEEVGAPVKILYQKDRDFFIGGDRPDVEQIYTIPDGYQLSGNPSLNNLGVGKDDWLANFRFYEGDLSENRMVIVTLSPTEEFINSDVTVPRVFESFGEDSEEYPLENNLGFDLDVPAGTLPLWRCFQNGFYTATGQATKSNDEQIVSRFVSYWADLIGDEVGELNYSSANQVLLTEATSSPNANMDYFYSSTRKYLAKTVFGRDASNPNFYFLSPEFPVAIGSNQESWLYIKDLGNTVVFEDLTEVREFPRAVFVNTFDDDKNLLDLYSPYLRPNLIGSKLFSIAYSFYETDPDNGQILVDSEGDLIPLKSIDVFVMDLSEENPQIVKESIDITQPTIDYIPADASAYIF